MTAVSRGDPVMWLGVSEHVAVRVCLRTSCKRPDDGDGTRVTAPARHAHADDRPHVHDAGRVTAPDPGL